MRGSSPFLKGISTASLRGRQESRFHIFILRSPGLAGATRNLLSYQRTSLDRLTLDRYHEKLRTLLPDLAIPGPKEETQNPSAAYRVYESCVRFLRERTRDQEKFPLVFAENVNYGFRRNLWAMKPIGFPAALVGIVGCALFVTRNWSAMSSPLVFALAAIAINSVLFFLWVFLFKPTLI